jgi:hypothetical protein
MCERFSTDSLSIMPSHDALLLGAAGFIVVLNGLMAGGLLVRSLHSPDVVVWLGRRTPAPRLLALSYLCQALFFTFVAISGSVLDPDSDGASVTIGVAAVFLVATLVTHLMWRRRRGQEPQV